MSRPSQRRRTRMVGMLSRAGLLGAVMVLLVAGPAAAHPFVEGGGEIPVDSLATITVDLAHGCASEAEGEGDDTTDVAVLVPDWMRVVDVPDADGWIVELETDDDGALEVVSWTDDGGATPAPTFDLDVVASGTAGESDYLGAYQACDDFEYRWIGTPDEPAEDPAINVNFVEADADNPPPPEEDDIVNEAAAEEEVPEDDVVEEEAPEDETVEEEAPEDEAFQDEPVEEEAPEDAVGIDEEVDEDVDADEAAADSDEGGLATVWIVLIVVAVIIVIVFALSSRNKKQAES